MMNTVGSFLNAYKAGGRIAILISDDGQGFLNMELALL